MDLERRVAELERRVAALEAGASGRATEQPERPVARDDEFWALDQLKARVTRDDGAVLFAGTVRVPTGERYEWQYGRTTDALLDADWSHAAESFAALGHPVRMRLLREILGGRGTVAELAALEDLGTTGQIYHHLRQLTSAGWLHTAARGRYQVPPGRVVPLLVALTTTGVTGP